MKKKKESGFTMIELLTALFVLSVVLLAVSSMVYSVMRSTSMSKETATATSLMQEKMEGLKHTPVASLVSGNDTVSQGKVSYARQWNIPSSANTRSLTVTVNWNSRGAHNLSTTTLRGE